MAAHLASPHTVFPYATYATLDGVKLSNANGEECGGTLETAFAVSCNSVFSPLGVKLGAAASWRVPNGWASTPPRASRGRLRARSRARPTVHGELELGSTAIGQGSVLATPLQMATVAATIADGGQRPQPTFLAEAQAAGASASAVGLGGENRSAADDRRGAPGNRHVGGDPGGDGGRQDRHGRTEERLPRHPGRLPGRPRVAKGRNPCSSGEPAGANTDAWFAAFAPALHPRLVVCVLLVKDGAGGDTAAPWPVAPAGCW